MTAADNYSVQHFKRFVCHSARHFDKTNIISTPSHTTHARTLILTHTNTLILTHILMLCETVYEGFSVVLYHIPRSSSSSAVLILLSTCLLTRPTNIPFVLNIPKRHSHVISMNNQRNGCERNSHSSSPQPRIHNIIL